MPGKPSKRKGFTATRDHRRRLKSGTNFEKKGGINSVNLGEGAEKRHKRPTRTVMVRRNYPSTFKKRGWRDHVTHPKKKGALQKKKKNLARTGGKLATGGVRNGKGKKQI